ncbi:hypothetical protein NPIL_424891 [Nephila pilipes]|uniref:Uncharacterized protein n=1 Tax=Nephila pilipes TaxID=299642 RepID=A0A8X6TQY6_NEPPI|nr:hypothetical protein NPIL_424891 [Nephila pilipes]
MKEIKATHPYHHSSKTFLLRNPPGFSSYFQPLILLFFEPRTLGSIDFENATKPLWSASLKRSLHPKSFSLTVFLCYVKNAGEDASQCLLCCISMCSYNAEYEISTPVTNLLQKRFLSD